MGQNISHLSSLPDLTAEVKIIVRNSESEPTIFIAPRGLLTERSGFFEDACRTKDPETPMRVVHLDDADPNTFTWYLMWVFRGKVVVSHDHNLVDKDWAKQVCADLVKLWLLANRLEDYWCRNVVMDHIVGILDHHHKGAETVVFSPSLITLIWSASEAISPLRRIVLDYYLSQVSHDEIRYTSDQLHPEFVKELMFEALHELSSRGLGTDKRTPAEVVEAQQCFYHDHWGLYPGTCGPEENLIREAAVRRTSLPAVFDFTKTMTIVINEDEPEYTATFTIPEALLVDKSEFFTAACRNKWKESTSRTMEIPEVNVDAFYAYVYWVYWEMVPVSSGRKKSFCSAAECEPTLNELVELWLLADRFADTRLRDLCMDALTKVTYSIYSAEKNWITAFPPEMTARIWSSTTRGRALRRFVIDVYESKVTENNLNEVTESFHRDFLVDLATKMMRMKGGEGNMVWAIFDGRCHDHEHEKGEKLCRIHRTRISGSEYVDLWLD